VDKNHDDTENQTSVFAERQKANSYQYQYQYQPCWRLQFGISSAMSFNGQGRPYLIFISRVTGEFAQVANALAADLRTKGIVGKLQVDFRQEPDTETTLDKLEKYIREADAVIALIGQRSGAYPPPAASEKWASVLPERIEKATYTQWEVLFAHFHKKRVSFYFGFDHERSIALYQPEIPPTATDDLVGQREFANWITAVRGMDRDYFKTEDKLCRLVLKEPWPVEVMARPPVEIHPEDLEELILHFDRNIDLFGEATVAAPDPEFALPVLEQKNELNKLSDDYFKTSILEDMPSFKKIEEFLRNPRNSEWRERYSNVSRQFRNKYQAHRGGFAAFETIFDDIFNRLRERGVTGRRDALIYTFVHYMYCCCDLGRRTPEVAP